jgi:hypothetical protein
MKRIAAMLALPLIALASICAAATTPATATAAAPLKTRNVVLIVLDGLRWQEVFSGADATLMNEKYGGSWESDALLATRFGNPDLQQRREQLMPFLWKVVAKQGQIYGNQKLGSVAQVSNAYASSYPGYSEMSVGHADPTIIDNAERFNANLNVFEWLNQQPDLKGKVGIVGSWHLYREIFNTPRSKLFIQAGATPPPMSSPPTPREELLTRLYKTTLALEDGDVTDSFVQVTLLDYLHAAHPRVLFVGYGDTDEWAHSGRYDQLLESAHKSDSFAQELWETMQAMPQYRDQTTFIITTDHGRGSGLVDWKEHGRVEQPGSENIWLGIIGPDTPPLGERHDVPPIQQAQIAATLAALLGADFRTAEPRAAAPLAFRSAP